jgi:hypothetical protein
MSAFVLVPGAWLGGWSGHPVAGRLRQRGLTPCLSGCPACTQPARRTAPCRRRRRPCRSRHSQRPYDLVDPDIVAESLINAI